MALPYESDILPNIYGDARQILIQIAAAALAGDVAKVAILNAELATVGLVIPDATAARDAADYLVVRDRTTRAIYELPISAIAGPLSLASLLSKQAELGQAVGTPNCMAFRTTDGSLWAFGNAGRWFRFNFSTFVITEGVIAGAGAINFSTCAYIPTTDRFMITNGAALWLFDPATQIGTDVSVVANIAAIPWNSFVYHSTQDKIYCASNANTVREFSTAGVFARSFSPSGVQPSIRVCVKPSGGLLHVVLGNGGAGISNLVGIDPVAFNAISVNIAGQAASAETAAASPQNFLYNDANGKLYTNPINLNFFNVWDLSNLSSARNTGSTPSGSLSAPRPADQKPYFACLAGRASIGVSDASIASGAITMSQAMTSLFGAFSFSDMKFGADGFLYALTSARSVMKILP